MAVWNDLPCEIRQLILGRVPEAEARQGPTRGLAKHASVSREWQLFFEPKIFRHFILDPCDLPQFEAVLRPTHRRRLVRHILLQVGLTHRTETLHALQLYPTAETVLQAEKRCDRRFSHALWYLMRVLARWEADGPGLTLEIGTYSPFENTARDLWDFERDDDGRETTKCYSKFLEAASVGADYPSWQDPIFELMDVFRAPDGSGLGDGAWKWVLAKIIGRRGLRVDLEAAGPDGELTLPEVPVVTDFLVRLRSFRNFDPQGISRILKCFPRIADVHVERWRQGDAALDWRWDRRMARLLREDLPPAARSLTVFDESDTAFHQQPSKLADVQPVPRLARAVFAASRRLENVAVSFLVDACDFFQPFWPGNSLPGPQVGWESLTSLALTSEVMTSESNASANELLQAAARAAMRMPKLRVMELWDRRGQDAAVFRYRATDRKSVISWLGTWEVTLMPETLEAWRNVVSQRGGGTHSLQAEVGSFPHSDAREKGFVFKHLELKDRILHDVSIRQVEEQDKVGGGVTPEEFALEFD